MEGWSGAFPANCIWQRNLEKPLKHNFTWEGESLVNYSHQGSLLLQSILLRMSMLFLCALLLSVNPSKFLPETVLQLCCPCPVASAAPGVAGSWEERAGWRARAAVLLHPCSTLPSHPLPSSVLQRPALPISPGGTKKALNSCGIIQSQTCLFTAAGS